MLGDAGRAAGAADAARRREPGASAVDDRFAVPTPLGVQEVPRPGVIELAFGVPDPRLLPVAEFAQRAGGALSELGPQALSYGAGEGPPQLREQLRRRIASAEGRAPTLDELVITGGISEGLERLLLTLTQPGDTVLVEVPTYSLALGIVRDHPVRAVGVPVDEDGLDVAALERLLDEAESAGSVPRLLYTIPTFHNPTGVSLAATRRRRCGRSRLRRWRAWGRSQRRSLPVCGLAG